MTHAVVPTTQAPSIISESEWDLMEALVHACATHYQERLGVPQDELVLDARADALRARQAFYGQPGAPGQDPEAFARFVALRVFLRPFLEWAKTIDADADADAVSHEADQLEILTCVVANRDRFHLAADGTVRLAAGVN